MALVFKIGEHEDFAPVPPRFPRCGNYRYDTTETTTISSINHKTKIKQEIENEVLVTNETMYSFPLLIFNELRVGSSASDTVLLPNFSKLLICTCFLTLMLLSSSRTL